MGQSLLESVLVPRLAQTVPAYPGAFEVCYLDEELSQLGRVGREVVWSGREQSTGAEGLSSNLRLTHGPSGQELHGWVQLENREETQVRISLRNPDVLHENKQGGLPFSLWSPFLPVCVSRPLDCVRAFLFLLFLVTSLQGLILISVAVPVFEYDCAEFTVVLPSAPSCLTWTFLKFK